MKKILLSLLAGICLCCSLQAQTSELNVATFNLRMNTKADGENAWPYRAAMVRDLVRYHDFDIFGTQEGQYDQLQDLLQLEDYAYIGVGRDDGLQAGEHSAIFYKKDRLEILDQGDFWFSETPDTPSLGWDATCCNRICSWGHFRDKETGKSFYLFNSHYDHQGEEARRHSSLMLLERIKPLIERGETIILTGDFNATPDSEPIQILSSYDGIKDAYSITITPPYGTYGTFNSFDIHSKMDGRIDYIWVSDGVKVLTYAVLNEQQYGRFPSDHFPVTTRIILP